MQVFTVGSLTLDIFLEPEEQIVSRKNGKEFIAFELGAKIRATGVYEFFGGSSSNVAVALRRLGISRVAAVGAVGEDAVASGVLVNLKSEKVSTKFVHRLPKAKTGFSVIVNSKTGRHSALVYPGANHDFAKLDSKIFRDCDALHLGRLSGGGCRIFETVRIFFKKNPEKFLSWNPGGEQISRGIKHFRDFLPVVDILFLNQEETEAFTKIRADKNCAPIFRQLFAQKFRGIAVITNGANGAIASDGEKIFHSAAFTKFKMRDTLGAGDAFGSTFLAAQILGKNIPDSLRFASVNSASVVSTFGTQTALLLFPKIKKLARGVRVSESAL